MLFSIDEYMPLTEVEGRLAGDVRITSASGRDGRKGFTAELRPEKRGFFKLHTHGSGMLSKGIGHYAQTSTLALLCWLLRRRQHDQCPPCEG